MVGVQEVIELLSRGVGLIRNHVAIPDLWPDATWAAVVAVLAGLVLALWGGRLLRALYVIAFMAIGWLRGNFLAITPASERHAAPAIMAST